jgi:hypothetical protein
MMTGEFWVGFGIGFLVGATLFDFLWRWLNRAERELANREQNNVHPTN